jgi:hypothetical protein
MAAVAAELVAELVATLSSCARLEPSRALPHEVASRKSRQDWEAAVAAACPVLDQSCNSAGRSRPDPQDLGVAADSCASRA